MHKPHCARATAGVWVAVLGALALVACGATYDPPSLINKLRLLGIHAEPAYVPASGETVLRALAVGEADGANLCYAWAFCPFAWAKNGAFRCIDPLLQVDLGIGATATVSTDVVMASLAQAPTVFKKLGMAQPGGAAASKSPSAAQDLPDFYVMVQVSTAQASGGVCPSDVAATLGKPCADSRTCLLGYKRLAWAIDPKKVNKNPKIESFSLDAVPWPEVLTPTAAPGDRLALSLTWNPADKEATGPSIDPKLGQEKETLLMSWFTTAGAYDKERSYDEVPGNVLTLPSLHSGEDERLLTVWVVVRDGRNGEDWTSRKILVKRGVSANLHPLCAADASLAGCDHLDAKGQVVKTP